MGGRAWRRWLGGLTVAALAGLGLTQPATAPRRLPGQPPAREMAAGPYRLLPVNEAPADPELHAFYQRLQEVVRRRASEDLLGYLAPQVVVDFGGGSGPAAFRRHWGLDTNPAGSPLWPLLDRILTLGGTFTRPDRTAFAAPYIYTRFPSRRFDPFYHAVIAGSAVPLRSQPDPRAPVWGLASHTVVRLPSGVVLAWPPRAGEASLVPVVLPFGQTAYVPRDALWSPVGYRLGLEKRQGRWQITFLVSGD